MRSRPRLVRIAHVLALVLMPELAAAQTMTARLAPRGDMLLPQRVEEPGLAMLASAVLPGAGQAMLGQNRWFPYVAAEAWGWVTYFDRRGKARSLEQRYKDLAWSVARRVSLGERRDTVFEYYETLAHFDASGAFDADPAMAGVQPETDDETFNGNIWRLAQSLFLPGGATFPASSVEYQRALQYYLARAVPAGYSWAWGASRLEQQHFNELIHGSDEAFREATLVLGAIIANHIVSAVDALVSARLNQAGAPTVRIRNRLDPGGHGGEWRLTVQIGW